MSKNTYVALQTQTLTTNVASVSFTGIDQTYTDLVLQISNATSTLNGYGFTFGINGDTGNNYSGNGMAGNGSATPSGFRYSNTFGSTWVGGWIAGMSNSSSSPSQATIRFLNYTSTSMYKTILGEYYSSAKSAEASVWTWRGSTGSAYQAINEITIYSQLGGGSIASGTTFTLYGIKAWTNETTPKATGGYVTSDSTYWYHAFPFSSTFVSNQTLSCDYIIVAGGGGGAGAIGAVGGGGGAGGFRSFNSQSISAGTYTVTVGSGGAGGAAGNNNGIAGSNSSFNSQSSTGGGYGGIQGSNGGSGGSGGAGGWTGTSGGAGNAGGYTPVEGYAGASTNTGASYDSTGGGGGAGAAGSQNGLHIGGAGGIGATSSLVNAIGTTTGFGEGFNGNYYFAGGGGGAAGYDAGYATRGEGGLGGGGFGGTQTVASTNIKTLPSNGKVNTGGGGGGAVGGTVGTAGGAGASGIVVIRYAK